MNLIMKKRTGKKYNCIAIIGNGFDVQHGLNSRYTDFIAATDSSVFDPFKKHYIDYLGDDDKWSSFEEAIDRLSCICYHEQFEDGTNIENIDKDIAQINEEFKNIRYALATYLKKEVLRCEKRPIRTVKRYLKSKTKVFNFNYTDIAEAYTNDIYYVHGSLNENDIVLGYDYRDEPEFATYDIMFWGKPLCRKKLAFCRYLRSILNIDSKSDEYIDILHEYEHIDWMRNSGKGLDEDDLQSLKHESLIRKYLEIEPCDDIHILPSIDYSKIRTMVVMGHSLVADKVLLTNILKKCFNLKKVVIFTYPKEKVDDYNKKVEFFKPFCKNIKKKRYRLTK